MNKKLLSALLIILTIIGLGMAYVMLQKNMRAEPDKIPIDTATLQEGTPPGSPGAIKGAYVEYTESSFTSTQGAKLLFFHASWCPQCRALDESIKASELPDGVTIFKVDYDTNQSLRAKYGVTLQTTVVRVDEKGDKISSYVAYDEPTFQSVKRALLP